MRPEEGRKRTIIEGVAPEIDGGRYPIKRSVNEKVVVKADIFTDGHDAIFCNLLYRHFQDEGWNEVPLEALGNDRWQGSFTVTDAGRYLYTLQAGVDHFKTWQLDLRKRLKAGQNVTTDLLIGVELIEAAAKRAASTTNSKAAKTLRNHANILRQQVDSAPDAAADLALDLNLLDLVSRYPDLQMATTYPKELVVVVDRQRARFSAWYEFFPRSYATLPGKHGTFKDCQRHLSYVAAMGFDILYLPPIHPIGRAFRKGRNNAVVCQFDDYGSPWAIGAEEGGHKATHPELGTLEDFRQLVTQAKKYGIDVALDIALQCSPDHPYVKDHPEWFRHRPDGTIQYAENPPKKYQDIYPFDFETENWQELWEELKSIFLFWIEHGVQVFRVDNPHTKPFAFWEWLITEVKREHPDIIFLAEAFTRPKVMYNLAKLGFTQSYTYFAWRNDKRSLTEYLTELTQSEAKEFFCPNFWPNTPDILNEYLQQGGRPAFMIRLILAAMLGASYGIYGPAFELCQRVPREAGSEEYLNSEKYEIKHWAIHDPTSLKDLIAQINYIRRDNPALQTNTGLRFHRVENNYVESDHIICFSKQTEDLSNVILVVVNLDPAHRHTGWLNIPLEELGVKTTGTFQVQDLLQNTTYRWSGSWNYVDLDPNTGPAHIIRLRNRNHSEQDFEYYT